MGRTNQILEESVNDLLAVNADPEASKRPDVMTVRISDFDGVQYSIQIKQGDDKLIIGVSYPGYKEIQEAADLELKARYGDFIAPEPDNGRDDVSLVFPIDEIRQKDNDYKIKLVNDIILLKDTIMCGPLKNYFTALKSGSPLAEPIMYNYRGDTVLYLIPSSDRVTVVFGIDFAEPTDKVIARVFMQELADVKKVVRSAPPFTWREDPPYDQCKIGPQSNPGILGYASLSILKAHISTDEKLMEVVSVLLNFRTFLQYHLKCAKSYFHSRMRSKCSALLKILNRAKVSFGTKKKTTKSGKTFTRKK